MNGRLADYVGCACEVKTMENDLLVIGKIRAVLDDENGQSIEIISSDGDRLPTAAYGIPVKVNLYSSKLGFLGLGGKVYITHESFWRINDITTFGENERRSYFRIKVHTHAEVTGPDKTNTIRTFKCTVTSVSLSGVLIALDDDDSFFSPGTEVYIHGLKVMEGYDSFDVKCVVCRTDEHHSLGRLYGCRFVDMSMKETDRLYQEIFAKQRIDIQKRRGRI